METDNKDIKPQKRVTTSSGIYGLAVIGSLIYFIEHGSTFGEGALGVLKALLWPAFLIYHFLKFLQL